MALAQNGLGTALRIAAWNGGAHVAPTFAGDTLRAFTEVVEGAELPGRTRRRRAAAAADAR